MDKYDYVTATIEEEKTRLEKLISYLKEQNLDEELIEQEERYNNILKYLNAKDRYYNIESIISNDKEKLSKLNKIKDEYEVDNILLEDTLLSKFHEDTNNEYRNLLYENIKKEEEGIRDILYLLFEKQSNYTELTIKRNRLKEKLEQDKYPNTYNTLISQNVLIEKQSSILNEIYLIENNIKIEVGKQKRVEEDIMTLPILKILYEFWIIDSYDINKVNKNKLFKDNRTLVSIKNTISETDNDEINDENVLIPNLNLPGINEEILVNIEGKKYIEKL